ncbi:MAG: phospholipase D-like domain-containing protein, partial [Bacteroidia bacterium]
MKWNRNLGLYPWHQNKEIPFLLSGAPFFTELIQSIHQSKRSIHIHVYIFDGDETGFMVYQALLEAAARGVQITLVLDAFGSKSFPQAWKEKLELLGMSVSFFSRFKLAFTFHTGTRLHHKIFIFDEQIALLGGINISNHYSAFGSGKTWLDFGVKVQGNLVQDLLHISLGIEKPLGRKYKQQYQAQTGTVKARILQNHWAKARFGISKQYRQSIRSSKQQITLVASYFLPSIALKRMLKNAQKRGVQVSLILGGISDVPIIRNATHHYYADLLIAGVQIYEWQASVLHAKLAFIDHDWMSVGSYNINHLSDFGSTECNIEIVDATYQSACLNLVKSLMEKSAKHIEATDYLKKLSLHQKLINYCAYHLMRFSFRMLFYFQSDLKSP